MVSKKKPAPVNPDGRLTGSPNPRNLEAIKKKRGHIYAAMLASALAGDAEAGRVCLELIGDLPKEGVALAEAA